MVRCRGEESVKSILKPEEEESPGIVEKITVEGHFAECKLGILKIGRAHV